MTIEAEPKRQFTKRGHPKIPNGRLEKVEELYLNARTEREISDECAKLWKITPRQVRRYLLIVRTNLAKLPRPTPEASRARAEEMLINAYRVAEIGSLKNGPDAKAMVQAARALGELDGLFGTKRFELSGPNGGPLQTQAQVVVMPPLEGVLNGTVSPVATEPGPTDAVPQLNSP